MGCGCNGKRNIAKQSRNIVAPKGVINSAKIDQTPRSIEKIIEEKKITESNRREKIIRALKTP